MSRYIITGGPGAGKTTLLNALKAENYTCSEEASRKIIRAAAANRTDSLPWVDLRRFASEVLEQMVLDCHKIPATNTSFYDRAVPDIIAYLKAAGRPVEHKYYEALHSHPYARSVFILPPWEAIYVNDSERWQTFGEARLLYEHIRDTYTELGFNLIELPRIPVTERSRLVIEYLSIKKSVVSHQQ